jgi:subtilisin-like proprotein convertase family protein
MKKFYTLALALFLAAVNAQSFSGSTGAISDDGTMNEYTAEASGLTGALGADNGLVKVCLNITHTYDSDLNVVLVSPTGATTTLFSGIGGGDDNFYGTCLSQSAGSGITTASAPFTGLFKPQQTLGDLNDGGDGNGTWTLRINDTYPFADTGTVDDWSIEFGSGAATPFVFTSSNLPIVLIDTDGVDIPDEPAIPGTMKIIDNGDGAVNYVTDTPNGYSGAIDIELRGNYSQSLPQKPYKFETLDATGNEQDVSILGMPEESDWCLISTYNDKVFMRNNLAYKLFSEMGHYSPRNRYCEVVVNGNYVGIYTLTEKIKRGHNRVDIAKLETIENSGLNVTGGYIIKDDYWDWDDSWQLNYHPLDHPDLDVRLVYEYPKPEDISEQQKTYIQSFINDYETSLYGDNFADAELGYAKYIDVDSFLDYFFVNELARNIDGFRKSCYFNKDKDPSASTLAKLNAGPVWDFDWAWKDIPGCSIFEATDGSGWAYLINDCSPDVNSPGWYVRLLQDPEFANKMRCRWEYFRTNILDEDTLDNYIDTTAAYLNEAQARHFDRWGNLGLNTGTPEVEADPTTFDAEVTQFKQWINLRLTWLDENMPGSDESCALGLNNPGQPGFLLYPNPAKAQVKVEMKNGELPDAVAIFDMTGNRVMAGSPVHDGTFDVSGLSNGIYICKITAKGKQQMVKLAIAK